MISAIDSPSLKPYLLRALHEWCADNGFTAYIAVFVDATVQVPREYVRDHEIVLNISADATRGLKIGNELIEFKGRFGGVPRDIMVPIGRVIGIYARETGQGMAFPMSAAAPPAEGAPAAAPQAGKAAPKGVQLVPLAAAPDAAAPSDGAPPEPPSPAGGRKRPALKRVK